MYLYNIINLVDYIELNQQEFNLAELLNDITNAALNKLSSEFIYRKLGLCFDYPTKTGTFPLRTLPRADEVCNNKPNTSGKDTGMYNCILNNALLFTGLASRFEIGFASELDDIIFDRLIGGTIRLGTVAPKNVIIRGLTGDGRYFYPESTLDTALLWIFTTWRTVSTTAVSIESQQKLINITTRWINKVSNQNYKIKEDAEPINFDNVLDKIKFSAILAVCAKVLNNESWGKAFYEKFSGEFSLPESINISELLNIQIALNTISDIFNEDSKITAITLPLMQKIANKALPAINKYKELNTELLDIEFNSDWREFSTDNNTPTPVQQRISNENESITTAAHAMLILLYSNDTKLIQSNKTYLTEVIKSIPWDKLILASSLTPLAEIHTKGVEFKLWDEKLFEYNISFEAEASLVAEFLEQDYDNKHKDKAGHINPPKKKPVIELSEGENKRSPKKKKKRRRKPKTAANKGTPGKNTKKTSNNPNANSNNNEKPKSSEEKKVGDKPQDKRNNKNRRNRRRRPSSAKKPPQTQKD